MLPELVLAELPPGTHVLVLTHDHAEDLAICDAAIRAEHLGPIGLIGSSAKWARFRSQLLSSGHAAETVDRIRTPIGLPGHHHEQGAGRHRRLRGRRAAGRLRARGRRLR